MSHIQKSAEHAVRDLLKDVGNRVYKKTGATTLHAIDHMDDGSAIELTVDINVKDGTAVFDFELVFFNSSFCKCNIYLHISIFSIPVP